MILVWGKARSCRAPNLHCRGAESPGWCVVLPKNSAPDVMCELVHCHGEAADHQLPIAAAFWIIQIVSMEECLSIMQNLMRIHCSTHLVIFSAMATQYTCPLSSVYHPHWLVQWSHHRSHMHIPVHSPWLPGYMNVSTNCSCYIKNGWTLSRQSSCVKCWFYVWKCFWWPHSIPLVYFSSPEKIIYCLDDYTFTTVFLSTLSSVAPYSSASEG